MKEVSGDTVSEIGQDSFNTRHQLTVDNKTYHYFSLSAATQQLGDITRLPYSLRILLENLLRHEDNQAIPEQHIRAFVNRGLIENEEEKIPLHPTRVILDESAGVEALIDLASMRDAVTKTDLPVDQVKPAIQTDLILPPQPQEEPIENQERRKLIRWGQQTFDNINVVLPTSKIRQQLDFEYLAKTVWSSELTEEALTYPDTCVGTSAYTTATNALGVLGWNVDTLEAETAMLGQPLPTSIPEVVGVKLRGELSSNATVDDLAFAINTRLIEENVAEKIVEFYGDALENLSIYDRAIISNTTPTTDAVCGYFPIDQQTIEGLALSGRNTHTLKLIKTYAQTQNLWRDHSLPDPVFDHQITIELPAISASDISGKQLDQPQTKSAIVLNISQEASHNTLDTSQHQIPSDHQVDGTYCWNPESSQIKPSHIPYLKGHKRQNGFKNARILALLEGTANTNPALIGPDGSQEDPTATCSTDKTDTLVIFGGQDFGSDPKQSYTAKKIHSLGVKAVIAESFNPTHRTHLVALGMLPLEFMDGDSWQALGLVGDEIIEIDLPKDIYPFEPVVMVVHRSNGRRELVELTARLDTDSEVSYYQAGGALASALQHMINQS